MQSFEERMDMLKETFEGSCLKSLPNSRLATERDVLRSRLFYTQPVGYIKLKEIRGENQSSYFVRGFYFYDGSWVAMSGYHTDPHITWWMGAICEHDYVQTDHGNCQHSKTCKKCGYTETWGSD